MKTEIARTCSAARLGFRGASSPDGGWGDAPVLRLDSCARIPTGEPGARSSQQDVTSSVFVPASGRSPYIILA